MAHLGTFIYLVIGVILIEITLARKPFNPFQAPQGLTLESYDVLSNVINNYAITVISAKYKNNGHKSVEAKFKHRLPYNAYISNLTVTYSYPGKFYKAVVKDESSEPERQIDEAFRVFGGPGHADNFSLIAPLNRNEAVLFTLIYEHPVSYRKGLYRYEIDLTPGHVTEYLKMKIKVKSNREIIHIEAIDEQLIGPDNEEVREQHRDLKDELKENPHFVTLVYSASKWDQVQVSDDGLNGVFSVLYDVEKENDTRYLMVGDQHFTYYFSPAYNPSPARHLVFMVDTSESSAAALPHIKTTIVTLLQNLNSSEAFSIITYNKNVKMWNGVDFVAAGESCRSNARFLALVNSTEEGCTDTTLLVTESSIKRFDDYPLTVDTDWKDLFKAFDLALNKAEQIAKQKERSPLIILISDWIDSDSKYEQAILEHIREQSFYDVPIFTLGFGNRKFRNSLEKISDQNLGFAENMFDLIRSKEKLRKFLRWTKPTSSTIQVLFQNVIHGSVSQTIFHNSLFGSEHVVSGKTLNDGGQIDILLTTFAQVNQFPDTRNWNKLQKEQRSIDEQYNYFLERLWAHSKLKALVKDMLRSENMAEIRTLHKRGVELSLQTNFATEFAPMYLVEADIHKEVARFPLVLLHNYRKAKQLQKKITPDVIYVPVQISLSTREQPGLGFYSCSVMYPEEMDVPEIQDSGVSIVTKPGGYNCQVSIKTTGGKQCSGVIVADRWVLTAADCVSTIVPEQVCVVAGEHNFMNEEREHQMLAADKILLHENPLSERLRKPFDVALIRLNKRLKLRDDIMNVYLPQEGMVSSEMANVSIWSVDKESDGWGEFKELSLGIFHDVFCRSVYGVDDSILPDSLMCAEIMGDPKESFCSVESGSPLLCKINDQPYLCGLATWAPTRVCEETRYPTLFTEVSYLVTWIDEVIRANH